MAPGGGVTGPTAKGLPHLCTTGDVAAAIGWSQKTIRRHCIPLSEWRARVKVNPDERYRCIPSFSFGAPGTVRSYKIPRWWLEDFLAVALRQPEPDE